MPQTSLCSCAIQRIRAEIFSRRAQPTFPAKESLSPFCRFPPNGKFGKPGRVCNAKVKDDSGEITLTLWNDDIDRVKIGDKVHIINGYVSEWQGEPQLTTGRFGKLEVVGGKEMTEDEAEEATIGEDIKDDKGENILTKDEKIEEEVLDSTKEEKVE